MNIDKKWLTDNSACVDGVEYYHTLHETDALKIMERLIADKKLQFANWTICHLLNKENQHKYAVFAAEQVFHLWKDRYPKKAAIWRKWVDAGCPKELRAAAWAAAGAAAGAAAWAAAGAAAGAAARAAAWAAAGAAARDAMLEKIICHGIELFREQENETRPKK